MSNDFVVKDGMTVRKNLTVEDSDSVVDLQDGKFTFKKETTLDGVAGIYYVMSGDGYIEGGSY
jgi:hypothetical protein